MVKEIERPMEKFKEYITEGRFPPKVVDFNKLPDGDAFWKLSVSEAQRMAGLSPLRPKDMGDILFWLNMVAGIWEYNHSKKK